MVRLIAASAEKVGADGDRMIYVGFPSVAASSNLERMMFQFLGLWCKPFCKWHCYGSTWFKAYAYRMRPFLFILTAPTPKPRGADLSPPSPVPAAPSPTLVKSKTGLAARCGAGGLGTGACGKLRKYFVCICIDVCIHICMHTSICMYIYIDIYIMIHT